MRVEVMFTNLLVVIVNKQCRQHENRMVEMRSNVLKELFGETQDFWGKPEDIRFVFDDFDFTVSSYLSRILLTH